MFDNILSRLSNSTVNVFFVQKVKKNVYTAYRLPNGLDNEIKTKYSGNLSNFVSGKTIGDYDFVHKDKNQIPKIPLESVEVWSHVLSSVNEAISKGALLKKSNFSDDYKMLVIDCVYTENGEISHFYLIAKYMKPDTWYKKGLKFGFTADAIIEKKSDIIVLNGCLDAVIFEDDLFVLQERNFEELFNYYEAAKSLVDNHKEDIESWPFMANADIFYTKATSGKIRTLKLANAFKNVRTDWASISPQALKTQLQSDERFSAIEFDAEDRIICTTENVELITDIIREVYSKQLVTNEIIQTKGI